MGDILVDTINRYRFWTIVSIAVTRSRDVAVIRGYKHLSFACVFKHWGLKVIFSHWNAISGKVELNSLMRCLRDCFWSLSERCGLEIDRYGFFYSRCFEVRVSRWPICAADFFWPIFRADIFFPFFCMLKCHTNNKWMHNISKFNIIYWTLTSTISRILILCTARYSN